MRSLHLLSCASAVSAFNLFPDIFKRQSDNCTVYTIVQYPCAVETWVASNTVLLIDACATTLNITNAPTSLTTILTSTTTLGITTTSEVTVVVSLQSAATPLTILTLPAPSQTFPLPFIPTNQSRVTSGVPHITLSNLTTSALNPTSTTEYSPLGTASVIPSAAACAPSSTVYPDPLKIPANTTYIIQVTSPDIVAQLGGTPVYLTREGGINYNADLAVQVFFFEDILFALDKQFGVGWYGTDLSSPETAFALEQYSKPSQSIARDFTTVPTNPLELAWNNCQFGNPSIVWALNVVDGLVHSWFSGVPGPASDVEVVTLLLVAPPGAPPPPSTSASIPDSPISSAIAPPISSSAIPASPTSSAVTSPGCIPPSTSSYAPGNSIPANTTYVLQLYWSPSPGSLLPYGGNVYLKRDGSYTAANSFNGAVDAFFVDGTLVAADPIFVYAWYTTTSPPVDAPFALGEYLPSAGLTARQFSMAPTSPPSLVWENCGFDAGAAEFVLDEDNGLVYVSFDGLANQGANHIPIYLVPTIYL